MKIVFVSNFFNHHQKPFSDCMYEITNGNYIFVQMCQMNSERIKMGWKMEELPSYVVNCYDDESKTNSAISTADIVICANGYESMMRDRLRDNKIVFIYGERLYKAGIDFLRLAKHTVVNYYRFGRYKNCYCLCSSAFAAYDWSRSRTFLNKCFKWGYFPQLVEHSSVSELLKKKESTFVSILYVSRQIELKHPELPIKVLKKLLEEGIDAKLTMIGDGPIMYKTLQNICTLGIKDHVEVIQSVSPEKVREFMDHANIFLFTSDRNEGWGAVLNESMNSACAVVASSEIGSVPFLIEDGKNGYIYEDGNFEDLYLKTKKLAIDRKLCANIGAAAYKSIIGEWNASVAAERLLDICNSIINKEKRLDLYQSGPCSKAQIIKDGWYESNY